VATGKLTLLMHSSVCFRSFLLRAHTHF
jgi:hypothetical protein